ncbi:hypothetical protein BDP27DRAFT_1403011 [Rhodocollybia butyracea]|uniref:F-box domain-containing protein n=1 Tax=Rhodocollybia butyracea TaxID=206335 RepID=A0A9P5PVJ8_9AGAR|nr:hypothetical protein BDP27DRAFT_1403011 [Rhodocollybia butyracea]
MCSSLESAYQALYTEFLAKSRHNDIPKSPVARARLRALIDQTRKDLQLCSEIPICNQISRVLEFEESLFAPIRILPSEVLTEIFQLVIETSSKPGIIYTSWKSPKLSGCIFMLTWICFWWRDEALSNSTFWSRIAVRYSGSSHAPPKVAAFLNECILRSGVLAPMRIGIYIERTDFFPSIAALLVAQVHRWRQAVLSFHYLQRIESLDSVDSLFPFDPSTHFPLLEDLSFNSDEPTIANRILECYPPLRKLELSELSESSINVIAGQKLKILKVGRYSGVSLARLLHMCPCLESLTLESFEFKGNPGINQITCRSSLSTLHIGVEDNAYKVQNGAWTGVTLPKLSKLDVTLPDLIDDENWETAYEPGTSLSELKEVVKQSKCALQRVNLIMYYGKEPQFTLEIADKFFEDLPVKAEGSFVESKLLQEWREDVEETIDE